MVDKRANKIQIKNAIETIFSVKVDKVRTMRMEGKKKRYKFKMGKRADWKKAIITLKEGYRIEVL